MLPPNVGDAINEDRRDDSAKRVDAVNTSEAIAPTMQMRCNHLAPQREQVMSCHGARRQTIAVKGALAPSSRLVGLKGFAHCIHRPRQNVVVAVNECDVRVNSKTKSNFSAGRNISLNTLHQMNTARLRNERFKATIKPLLLGSRVGKDVNVYHRILTG